MAGNRGFAAVYSPGKAPHASPLPPLGVRRAGALARPAGVSAFPGARA